MTPNAAFNAQVDTLVRLGYPRFFGLTAHAFRDALAPLQQQLPEGAGGAPMPPPESSHVPWVLVVHSPCAPVADTLALATRRGQAAFERLFPKAPADFAPIAAVQLPEGDAYLLQDVDRGAATLNVTPDEALRRIEADGRSPLTLEEGVALLTHFPEFPQPNNCFSLLASRCGDKRVPALWLSAGRPRLGWCWAGNPHTWLGSASCAGRSAGVAVADTARAVAAA